MGQKSRKNAKKRFSKSFCPNAGLTTSRHRNNIVAFKSLGQLLVPGMQTCLVSEWTDSQCTGSGVSGCSAADVPARKVDGSLPTTRAV